MREAITKLYIKSTKSEPYILATLLPLQAWPPEPSWSASHQRWPSTQRWLQIVQRQLAWWQSACCARIPDQCTGQHFHLKLLNLLCDQEIHFFFFNYVKGNNNEVWVNFPTFQLKLVYVIKVFMLIRQWSPWGLRRKNTPHIFHACRKRCLKRL